MGLHELVQMGLHELVQMGLATTACAVHNPLYLAPELIVHINSMLRTLHNLMYNLFLMTDFPQINQSINDHEGYISPVSRGHP